jgi:DNA helicase II / ATP-dependent DNA helicase PcrA
MSGSRFEPTQEQVRIIDHAGSAFVVACPGAGKTRVLVERARRLLADRTSGRGVAFLSFTTAAVSELESRLRREGLLPTPGFPHFIGTFDGFLWQFLIAPFGVPGCGTRPRLVPDKDDLSVQPFAEARALPLSCFERNTGTAIAAALKRCGFDGRPAAHETAARAIRGRLLERGEIDYEDARIIALARLKEGALSKVLAVALNARFREVIVDEAQDCNPTDLKIIEWLLAAKIPVKVVCDPDQSIYEFRGGVTDQLFEFGRRFPAEDQLALTGNFRSSAHICKAIVAMRAPTTRAQVDEALGPYRAESTRISVLSYPGTSVPKTVGAAFRDLAAALGLDPANCPILAATRLTGASALGQPAESGVRDLSLRLALAVSDYHFASELGGRKDALETFHRLILELEGQIGDKTYHQHIAGGAVQPSSWRPRMLGLVEALRYDPARFPTAEDWLSHARALLESHLPEGGASINQRLKRNTGLAKALVAPSITGHTAKTIHSVKGMQFPAVCVVISVPTARGIIDYISTGNPASSAEDARKIYVAASRAQRLLAMAVPKSQAARLTAQLRASGADVSPTEL